MRRERWVQIGCVAWLAATISAASVQPPVLRDVFAKHFLVGVAVTPAHIEGRDPARTVLLTTHFNAITPENALKWDAVHPQPGRYRFDEADRLIAFGERHGMVVIGHTLIWHSQTPRWVFEDEQGRPLGRDALLDRMREHIHTVVGRYRGRIKGWDVVNEALDDDGRLRDSPWRRAIGDDYVLHAFRFAHEADPSAELYYNDYNLELPAKRRGAIELLQRLQAAGVRVSAVGIQGHYRLDWPSTDQLAQTIAAVAALGLKVMISELDIDVLPLRTRAPGVDADVGRRERGAPELDPYRDGLPDAMQQRLAQRYAELFAVFLEHAEAIDRVTFWGITDGDSWLNHVPIRGRTAHPLLFDRAGRPKPAFDAVIRVARGVEQP